MAGVRGKREGSRCRRVASYTPAGAPRQAELTGLFWPAPFPRLGQLRFRARPERSRSPGPWGVRSLQTSGTPKLERNLQPRFLPSFVTFPAFSQRVLFFLFILPPKDTKVASAERFGGGGSFSLRRATV